MKGAGLKLQRRHATLLSTTFSLPFPGSSLRRKRGRVGHSHVPLLSRFLPLCHLFLVSGALSLQVCGRLWDYCFNAFLICILKPRGFVLGLWAERRAQHRPQGPAAVAEKMLLCSSLVAGLQEGPLGGLGRAGLGRARPQPLSQVNSVNSCCK